MKDVSTITRSEVAHVGTFNREEVLLLFKKLRESNFAGVYF